MLRRDVAGAGGEEIVDAVFVLMHVMLYLLSQMTVGGLYHFLCLPDDTTPGHCTPHTVGAGDHSRFDGDLACRAGELFLGCGGGGAGHLVRRNDAHQSG